MKVAHPANPCAVFDEEAAEVPVLDRNDDEDDEDEEEPLEEDVVEELYDSLWGK